MWVPSAVMVVTSFDLSMLAMRLPSGDQVAPHMPAASGVSRLSSLPSELTVNTPPRYPLPLAAVKASCDPSGDQHRSAIWSTASFPDRRCSRAGLTST